MQVHELVAKGVFRQTPNQDPRKDTEESPVQVLTFRIFCFPPEGCDEKGDYPQEVRGQPKPAVLGGDLQEVVMKMGNVRFGRGGKFIFRIKLPQVSLANSQRVVLDDVPTGLPNIRPFVIVGGLD